MPSGAVMGKIKKVQRSLRPLRGGMPHCEWSGFCSNELVPLDPKPYGELILCPLILSLVRVKAHISAGAPIPVSEVSKKHGGLRATVWSGGTDHARLRVIVFVLGAEKLVGLSASVLPSRFYGTHRLTGRALSRTCGHP
jgi:hypothetical protein